MVKQPNGPCRHLECLSAGEWKQQLRNTGTNKQNRYVVDCGTRLAANELWADQPTFDRTAGVGGSGTRLTSSVIGSEK